MRPEATATTARRSSAPTAGVPSPSGQGDWVARIERLLAGDSETWHGVSRLVEGFLVRWQAHDVRMDWPDIVQEVLIALLEGLRCGKLRDRCAFVGYLRAIAHHKLVDRLRRRMRCEDALRLSAREGSASHGYMVMSSHSIELRLDVRSAVSRLADRRRQAIQATYEEGRTIGEVARHAGVSERTVKRDLHHGLLELRRELSGDTRDDGLLRGLRAIT